MNETPPAGPLLTTLESAVLGCWDDVLLGVVLILVVAREPGDRMRELAVMAVLSPLWGTLLHAAWHGMCLTRDVF